MRRKEEREVAMIYVEYIRSYFFSRDFLYEVVAEVLPVLESTKQLL